MAVKKSELYSSLWESCDQLRGGMDASQYKDYILVLLFVKYVSDKYAGQPHALIEVPQGRDIRASRGSKTRYDSVHRGRFLSENRLRSGGDLDPQTAEVGPQHQSTSSVQADNRNHLPVRATAFHL